MIMNEIAFIGLGSNIGDRESNIFSAIAALDVRNEINVKKTASIYETEPLYNKKQPAFLNTVVEIETTLTPEEMLQVCKGIELMLGRKQIQKKNEPRVIDLDILAFETISIKLSNLNVPHPQLFARKFVLAPWSEINPDFVVQDFGQSISTLLKVCPDKSRVNIHTMEKSA